MHTRRKFLIKGTNVFIGLGLMSGSILAGARWLWAKAKKIVLPRETKRESLINRNPAQLDTRNLEITPLKDFRTMGLTDHGVDLKKWRLEVSGEVTRPKRLTYEEILGMPPIERRVLLICPGVFANHGKWKGVSIKTLLQMTGVKQDVRYVDIRGPEGAYEKVLRCPIEDVLTDKVFLAYAVNGQELPRKHGFPLRIVAEDYYGYDWVKYVCSVTAAGK